MSQAQKDEINISSYFGQFCYDIQSPVNFKRNINLTFNGMQHFR